MRKLEYSEEELMLNNVLNHQSKQLSRIKRPSMNGVNSCIADSEELLVSLGYEKEMMEVQTKKATGPKTVILVPSWEQMCLEAEKAVGSNCELEYIFTEQELKSNDTAIRMLNREYNSLHGLDKFDYGICALAGIVAGAVDILMVGMPKPGTEGVEAGPLSDYIRKMFNEKFPQAQMEKLAISIDSKVPYDAQDNRNTTEYVAGLSAYYHRLLSFGHDPLLGFVVGVFDILTGRMTTIDKTGNIVSQVMENYSDRRESNLFAAFAKQIVHLQSDITTSMGLPVPLMELFNVLQFGKIGDDKQTIAEIVQGMYYEGYDFIHFCSMSVPAMLVEVIVRLCYAVKRINEGNSLKESIPFSLNREKNPKLASMLFIGHAGSTAINAGKVHFSGNPMAINYPQWLAFTKYSYSQLKWAILEKPAAREAYVFGTINAELKVVYDDLNAMYEDLTNDYILVFNGV